MKVIIHKETGEYAHYFGRGEFALSNLPYVYPDTMNEEEFKKYVLQQEGCEVSFANYEVKNIEIIVFND